MTSFYASIVNRKHIENPGNSARKKNNFFGLQQCASNQPTSKTEKLKSGNADQILGRINTGSCWKERVRLYFEFTAELFSYRICILGFKKKKTSKIIVPLSQVKNVCFTLPASMASFLPALPLLWSLQHDYFPFKTILKDINTMKLEGMGL